MDKNRLVVAKRGREGGGRAWKFGVSRCKLLHIEMVYNKVLLFSTGNYIQQPMINIIEKNMRKNTYISLNHFAVHQKLTQHFKSTILQYFFLNEILLFATTWMDLEGIILSDISLLYIKQIINKTYHITQGILFSILQ